MGAIESWLLPALGASPLQARAPAPAGASPQTPDTLPLQALIDSLPHAAWLVDGATRRVAYANAAAHALLGRPVGTLCGEPADAVICTPEDLAYWADLALGAGEALESETWLIGTSGLAKPVLRSIRPVTWAAAAPSQANAKVISEQPALWYTVVAVDLSERYRAEEQLEQVQAELSATLQSTTDGLLVTDLAGRTRNHNPRFAQLWRMPESLLHARDDRALHEWMRRQAQDPQAYDSRLRELVNATTAQATDTLKLLDDRLIERTTQPLWHRGQPMGRVYAFRDLSERAAANRRIAHLATTDALTGLPNRHLLAQSVRQACAAHQGGEASFSLMLVDLDRFGAINETLGAALGDLVLLQVARRLQSVLRHGDMVARVAGDQFALLVHGADQRAAELTASRVVNAVAVPMQIEDLSFTLTCSVGLAMSPPGRPKGEYRSAQHEGVPVNPQHAERLDELLQSAEEAMREAKAAGRNGWRVHRLRRSSDPRTSLRMDHVMRQALAEGRFHLHYQPQIDMRSGAIVGAEALLRWREAEFGGEVPPARFIPVAEESGFIVALGHWVMDNAVQQSARWLAAGVRVPVAVNVSALQFHQPGFVEQVIETLQRHGLPARWLELELTESILVKDAEDTLKRLHELADLGVRLSIDDFGTGYSSLSYLKRFPIDQVKIDRSFVSGLPGDRSSAGIVKAILQMAQALGKEVIAEGVESRQQHRFLRNAGCARFQGFLFAPALEAAQFEQRWRCDHRARLRRPDTSPRKAKQARAATAAKRAPA